MQDKRAGNSKLFMSFFSTPCFLFTFTVYTELTAGLGAKLDKKRFGFTSSSDSISGIANVIAISILEIQKHHTNFIAIATR